MSSRKVCPECGCGEFYQRSTVWDEVAVWDSEPDYVDCLEPSVEVDYIENEILCRGCGEMLLPCDLLLLKEYQRKAKVNDLLQSKNT